MAYSDDIIYHKTLLEQQKNRIYLDTIKSIQALQPEIKLLATGATETNLTKIIAEAKKAVDESYQELFTSAEKELKAIAAYEADFQKAILLNTVAVGSKSIIENVSRELLYKTIFKDSIEGLTFVDNMSVITQSLKRETERAIRIGVLNGETVSQIKARVQQQLNISNNKYNSFIRTAVQNVTHTATDLTYKNNSEFIQRYQYVAILDGRTSDICKKLDGNVYKVGEGKKPPQHWNCRSFTIPIFSDDDIIDSNYGDWVDKQDAKDDKNLTVNEKKQFKPTNKTITIEQQRRIEEQRLDRKI